MSGVDLEFSHEGIRITDTHIYTGVETAFGLHQIEMVKPHRLTMRSICETRRAVRSAFSWGSLLTLQTWWASRFLEPVNVFVLSALFTALISWRFYTRYVQHRTLETLGVIVQGELCFLCEALEPARAEQIREAVEQAVTRVKRGSV
jgi:hypothetical protein